MSEIEIPTGDEARACVRTYKLALLRLGRSFATRRPNTRHPRYLEAVRDRGSEVARLQFMTVMCMGCDTEVSNSVSEYPLDADHWCDPLEGVLRSALCANGMLTEEQFDAMSGGALALFLKVWMER